MPGFEATMEAMGLSGDGIEQLRAAQVLYAISYEGPPMEGHRPLLLARRLALLVAELGHGVLGDNVCFQFRAAPEGGWRAELDEPDPLLPGLNTTVHSVQERADTFWVHTHGMAKYALPDLELREVAEDAVPFAHAYLMELAEGAIRDQYELAEGRRIAVGEHQAECSLAAVHDPDYGGPAFRVILPGDRWKRPRRTMDLLAAYAGVEDSPVNIERDDEEMLAAKAEALAALPEVRRRFERAASGQTDDAEFAVKACFTSKKAPDEYLWVQVRDWTDGTLTGLVMNQPQYARGVRYGQQVRLQETDLYDWTIVKQDRTWEGNFSGRVLAARYGQELPETL
jgi:uncharacterized protein YegJ (DUF2314 family)